jgi:hypothetical protein
VKPHSPNNLIHHPDRPLGGSLGPLRLGVSAVNVLAFANQIELDPHGWAQLAPFGDYSGQALIPQPDGSTAKIPAVQRLDRLAADAMVAKFKSPWNRLKRYFTGCPIYVGHPDVPALANDNSDKSAKGIIVDLQVRADGLYCKPVFTSEGSHLVESRQFRAFSAYWTAQEIGEQSASAKPIKIYRPDVLKSAGLTNHPNLPVHLLNEKPAAPAPQINSLTQPNLVNKQIIIEFLAAQGITIANETPDTQIASAFAQIGHRLATAETTIAARAFDLESLTTELANERQFHADALLDHALATGSITAAQRPDWAARLAADFANSATALAQLPATLKTQPLTLHLGARKADIANVSDRRDTLDTLIKTEMTDRGLDYDRAFAAVQKSNPALFSAMKQPLNPS